MGATGRRIGARLLLCGVLALLLWWGLGAVGLVFAAVPAGAALARPLLDLFTGSWHQVATLASHHALRGTRHYRGHALRTLEDASRQLWLCVADVRQIVEGLPDGPRLQAACGERCTADRWRQPAHVRADALIDCLDAAQARPTRQFVRWLRQELASDQRRRERGQWTAG